MWDQAVRLSDFEYPACAASARKRLDVELSLTYTLGTACDSVSLIREIRNTFTVINVEWSRAPCNAMDCSGLAVTVDCSSQSSTAKVKVTFTQVPEMLTSLAPDSKTLEDILLVELADNKKASFTFLKAEPNLMSLEIKTTPSCSHGYLLSGDYCVECAEGTYYDTASGLCELCPINTYQDVTGQESCKGCPTGERTSNTGAKSPAECYTICYVGGYRELSTGSCQRCPVGFYQDQSDSYYCWPCTIALTTNDQGSDNISKCIPYSMTIAPTTFTATTLGGAGGSVGASTSESMTTVEIVAIVIGLFAFALAIFIILICCCRDRLPCMKKKISPEEVGAGTPWKFVNRYGETNIKFVSYRLNDIREKRGLRKSDKQPIVEHFPEPVTSQEETGSVATDISVHLPVFMEKLDGKVQKKSLYMNSNKALNGEAANVGKKSKKKHRRSAAPLGIPAAPAATNLPPLRGNIPSPQTQPKALPTLPDRLRSGPPSEVSMATSLNLRQSYRDRDIPQYINAQQTALRPATLPVRRTTSTPREEYSRTSQPFPPRQHPQKSHRIQVDSDEEDYR
ncbi:hypothetical protein ScPMuIL_003191 [Solemya velum]